MSALLTWDEAEQHVLGYVLCDNRAADQVKAEDFSDTWNGHIFDLISDLIADGQAANPLTLRPQLEDMPAGLSYVLAAVAQAAADTPAQFADYLKIMKSRGARPAPASNGHANGHDDEAGLAELERRAPGAQVVSITDYPRRSGTAARQAEWAGRESIDFGKLIWNDGTDDAPIPPREWLLGVLFCRGFVSSLLGDGATGKTAVRLAMALAMATGCGEIVGEHVFQRCRVLYLSFEDSKDELRRRVRAAKIYHGIDNSETDDWLFLGCISNSDLKLGTQDRGGRFQRGPLADALTKYICDKEFNVVIFDPFVKTHGVNENDNNAVDQVMDILTGLAIEHDLAVDTPHHTRKGNGEPGDADVGRGATAAKNAGRLVYTLTKMSDKEAELMGVSPEDRRFLVRHDSAKVNISPPTTKTKWFKLVDVEIGNGTELYPSGDHVQTVEVWHAKDFWSEFSAAQLNIILDEIDAGIPNGGIGLQRYYSAHPRSGDRAVALVIKKHLPNVTDAQAQDMANKWMKTGVFTATEYDYRSREEKGVRVNPAKRPG